MFRNSPNHPTVIVTNTPYINPLEPEPRVRERRARRPGVLVVGAVPEQRRRPRAGPDCTGNATQGSGGQWRSPTGNTSYRSSKAKMDQFNQIIQLVKNNNFAGDPGVMVFNFKSHFNAGPANTYTDYVCPPPHDTDTDRAISSTSASGRPRLARWSSSAIDGSHIATNFVNAILARAADHGHLSPAGQAQILQPYIDKCVRALPRPVRRRPDRVQLVR